MKRILVLEDEFFMLDLMTRYLRALPDVRVNSYSSLQTAFHGLQEHPPDLIFASIRLGDDSGADLLRELTRRSWEPPVVLIAETHDNLRECLPEYADLTLLDKPLSLRKLREIAGEKLTEADHSGEFFFKLSDYLQIAAMGRHSVSVSCSEGGCILVVDGTPWHASDQQGEGPPAFKRIVARSEAQTTSARITCTHLDPADAGSQTLSGSLNGLLLDAVREFDEKDRDGETNPETSSPEFEHCYERGVELMLAKQYQPAFEAFAEAHRLNPDNANVRVNMDRLQELINNAGVNRPPYLQPLSSTPGRQRRANPILKLASEIS